MDYVCKNEQDFQKARDMAVEGDNVFLTYPKKRGWLEAESWPFRYFNQYPIYDIKKEKEEGIMFWDDIREIKNELQLIRERLEYIRNVVVSRPSCNVVPVREKKCNCEVRDIDISQAEINRFIRENDGRQSRLKDEG